MAYSRALSVIMIFFFSSISFATFFELEPEIEIKGWAKTFMPKELAVHVLNVTKVPLVTVVTPQGQNSDGLGYHVLFSFAVFKDLFSHLLPQEVSDHLVNLSHATMEDFIEGSRPLDETLLGVYLIFSVHVIDAMTYDKTGIQTSVVGSVNHRFMPIYFQKFKDTFLSALQSKAALETRPEFSKFISFQLIRYLNEVKSLRPSHKVLGSVLVPQALFEILSLDLKSQLTYLDAMTLALTQLQKGCQ